MALLNLVNLKEKRLNKYYYRSEGNLQKNARNECIKSSVTTFDYV